MKVAAVQHDICWEDAAGTHERLRPTIAAAVAQDARLVVLTEMFATGFSMSVDRVVEDPDGPSTSFLLEQAAEHGVWVCGSIPLRWPAGPARPRNVFTLVSPTGDVHRYAKLHPFSYGREHEVYEPGAVVLTVDVEGVRVTPFVCYDLRFANVFWERAHDTDLYVVVANWPAARREHWMALLRARAIEDQAYVVGVNRVGEGGGIGYSGDSRIVDPLGNELATASGAEALLVVDVEPARVAEVRREFPFLADRREL
jgi:predicted amidohydrolase